MFKTLTLLSLLASGAYARAQAAAPPTTAPAHAAPIVRTYPGHPQDRVVESQPIIGVWLRSSSSSTVTTVSATQQQLEVRLEHGRLNVNVHHPADHTEILIDLPGGQTSLLKNGLYTFNAETSTVRVLRGEAAAYVGATSANAKGKPVKIKEDHQLSLVAGNAKTVEAYPYELRADLLPLGDRREGDYGHGGYAAYPYYAGGWGYPYGYGFYPGHYGGYYGYPFAYGIGFGYYGGFGGFRGGFRR